MILDPDSLVERFIAVAALAGVDIPRKVVDVERWPAPHAPRGLPPGRMAVYVFVHGERVLKVGMAGRQSDARYRSQHYRAGSSGSNLSRSLVRLGERVGITGLTDENAGSWIKQHTQRVNFLLPASLDIAVLGLLEAFVRCALKPDFEGFESQRAA